MLLTPQEQKHLDNIDKIEVGKSIAIAELLRDLEENLKKIIDSLSETVNNTVTIAEKALQESSKEIEIPDYRHDISEIRGKLLNIEDIRTDILNNIDKARFEITLDLNNSIRQQIESIYKVIETIPTPQEKDWSGSITEAIKQAKKDIESLIVPSIPETGEGIVSKINELPITPDSQIDASHIKNLPKQPTGSVYGAKLLSSLADVSVAGVTSGQYLKWNGSRWVPSGVSGYQSPSSGTVDGSNTIFVFATAPTVLVVDGVPRQKTQSDGTINWTGTTTITLSIAPNFDIFAIA